MKPVKEKPILERKEITPMQVVRKKPNPNLQSSMYDVNYRARAIQMQKMSDAYSRMINGQILSQRNRMSMYGPLNYKRGPTQPTPNLCLGKVERKRRNKKSIVETSPCGTGLTIKELQMLQTTMGNKYQAELGNTLPILGANSKRNSMAGMSRSLAVGNVS